MTELKTLKDIELYKDLDKMKYPTVSSEELRQEGIKWIEYYSEGDYPIAYERGIKDFIEAFFNLTEEDLK